MSSPIEPGVVRARVRTRPVWTGVALFGVAVAAAAGTVAVRLYRDNGSPAAVVRAYFAALDRGDVATALASGAVPAGGTALLSSTVQRALTAREPVTDLRIATPVVHGASADVGVRYRIGRGGDAAAVSDVVPMVRRHGDWRLAHSAVALDLSVNQAATWAAVIGPQPFAVPRDVQLLFPGAVPVVFRSALLSVDTGTPVVRFAGGTDRLTVLAAVTPAGRRTVAAAVDRALTSCVAGGTAVDPYCPQPPGGQQDGVDLRTVPQSFHGRLAGPVDPSLGFQVAPGGGGTIDVVGRAEVEGTWQVLDYDNVAQDRSGSVTLTFAATVAVTDPTVLSWERT